MDEEEVKHIGVIPSGAVEYSAEDAATHIDDLIRMFAEMRDDGITHVVLESGNHRGPHWQILEPSWEWLDE